VVGYEQAGSLATEDLLARYLQFGELRAQQVHAEAVAIISGIAVMQQRRCDLYLHEAHRATHARAKALELFERGPPAALTICPPIIHQQCAQLPHAELLALRTLKPIFAAGVVEPQHRCHVPRSDVLGAGDKRELPRRDVDSDSFVQRRFADWTIGPSCESPDRVALLGASTAPKLLVASIETLEHEVADRERPRQAVVAHDLANSPRDINELLVRRSP